VVSNYYGEVAEKEINQKYEIVYQMVSYFFISAKYDFNKIKQNLTEFDIEKF